MRTALVPPARLQFRAKPALAASIASALASAVLLGGAASSQAQTTGWNQTAANTFDYNTALNWVDGIINGIWDPSLTLLGSQTITFAADTELTTGLNFSYAGGFNETLRGTGGNFTLTLGGNIIVNTASTTRVINLGGSNGQNLNVDLGGVTRTFTVGSGRTLGFVNVVSNGGIIASGGTINFSGANIYTGPTQVNAGNVSLNGASGSAIESDFTVKANPANISTLTFNSSTSGVTGTTRTGNVTLHGVGNSGGVLLTVSGNAGANSIDTVAGSLDVAGGFATVSVSANAARSARLEIDGFTRSTGSTVLFRGSDLGISPGSSLVAGDANIFLGTVPLVGGGGANGPTTLSLIKGAYGDVVSNGNGSGLVTHDLTNGVRLLDTATEYAAAISNGQSELTNVRHVRASGGATQDTHLTAATTTINSLSFRLTGTGTNTGVTISGDAGTSLKLNSGMIYASQAVTTANSTDAMTVSVPTLDLNGQEGVFIAFTSGISNGNTPAPLLITSSIANDGGNGVTIGGTGEVIFGGSSTHSYTGVTTVNSGILRLNKSVPNIAIPGDLVMNGGTLLKESNAIPNTADVTLNGGTFWFDNTTSSGNNNHSETIANLTMNGGNIGHHGRDATFNIDGDATITAGDLLMNPGGNLTVLGTTTLSGGRVIAKESSSTSTVNALADLGPILINQPASGAYTPIVLSAHATNLGGRLTLGGDLTFVANAANTGTTSIDSSDSGLANQGVIALNGSRAFNIGNGPAAVDFAITPVMTDGPTSGGLIKTGLGTLAIGGAHLFTGPTTVSAGQLLVSGSLSASSPVDVGNGGILGGTGVIQGTVTVNAGGTLLAGSGSAAADDLEIAGDLMFADASRIRLALGPAGIHSTLTRLGGTWIFDDDQSFDLIDLGMNVTTYEDVITGFNTAPDVSQWHISNPGYAGTFIFDGVNVDLAIATVPEPSAVLGALAGAGAVLALRRRRR